jgi:ribulose-phosphate 3-epimerase
MKIIPSILVKTKQELAFQLKSIQNAVDFIQIDIADGKFVPNKTYSSPQIIAKEAKTNIELHLMVADPVKELKKWKQVMQIKRIIIHYESILKNSAEILEKIKKQYGWKLFLAINPDTELKKIDKIINYADGIMLMGVSPGLQKQPFNKKIITRIKNLKKKYPKLVISVDGGVNITTILKLKKSGADIVCPGSAIFHSSKTPIESLRDMKTLLNG